MAMGKMIMAGIFGGTVAFTLSIISNYGLYNWQWWVAFMSITLIGVIYANIKRRRDETQD